MAKGFARLGILPALLFVTLGARAAWTGEPTTAEFTVGPNALMNSRDNGFERFDPPADTRGRLETTIDDNRLRIETDLLILPAHYQALAASRPIAFTGSGSRTNSGYISNSGSTTSTRNIGRVPT